MKHKTETVACSIILPKDLKEILQQRAKERNISFNAIIRMIASEWLNKNE